MRRISVCAAAFSLLLTTALATGAQADTGDTTEAVASTVSDVAPDVAEIVVLQADGDALEATSANIEVSVPVDPESPITLADEGAGSPVGISLPAELDVTTAQVAQDGTVVYADAGGGADAAVQALADGSVRIQTIISEPTASREYTYALDVPAGSTLTVRTDGSVEVSGADGQFVMGLIAPWAKDANGNDVPTSYRVDGTSVVQVVDFDSGTAFPVVADPYLFIDLISKVTRVSSAQGLIYSVTPTAWGRGVPDAGLGALWNEAVSKGVPNRQGLYEQLICHPLSQVARVKSTWNLDTWRPTVGLVRTIAALCNP